MDLKNSNINYQMYSELDVSDDVGFELEKLTYPYEREVVNYVLIEMNVSDFKKKIKNNSIKNISIMDEKYENHYFEYYKKMTDPQDSNDFTIMFNNDKGRLILNGSYNDNNISGKFTSEGLLSNILIKNNKGFQQ